MATNINQFNADIDKEFLDALDPIENIVKEISMAILTYVTAPPPMGTPRVTGYTSNSWHISLNSPTSDLVGMHSTFEGANAAEARQLSSINELMVTDDVGMVYINNNTDWISDLDSGTSNQSPGGFTGLAVQYAEALIDNFNREHK